MQLLLNKDSLVVICSSTASMQSRCERDLVSPFNVSNTDAQDENGLWRTLTGNRLSYTHRKSMQPSGTQITPRKGIARNEKKESQKNERVT